MIYQIGQLADIIDGDRGKNYPKQNEFLNQGYCLFLNAGNVTSDGFSFEENVFVSEEKDNLLRKGKLQRGDIVYTTRGTVGNAAFYSATVPFDNIRINSGMVILRCHENIVDKKYLYQILKSEYFRPYFKKYCTGSAQPQLPIMNFSKIELNIPELATQRRIADILSVYDDLIENNQKQIKLLEEAAQRLYKEWFVNLRFPGYEHTKIVDGVPEGWKVLHISDVCDTIGGGTPSTKVKEYYQNGSIPWVTPTDITKKVSLVLLDTATKITNEGLNHSSAKIVPPGTILMTSRASVGFFGICDFPVCTNQGFISCVSYQHDMQMYLLYNLLNRVDEIRGKAGGSTYLEISKKTFREFEIIVPNIKILTLFQVSTEKSIERIRILSKQIAELKQARNCLLAKLMNKKVEV